MPSFISIGPRTVILRDPAAEPATDDTPAHERHHSRRGFCPGDWSKTAAVAAGFAALLVGQARILNRLDKLEK